MMLEKNICRRVFERLLDAFGPQGWWPADTPFEMMVGAILTQHTSWENVERAIGRLKASGRFGPGPLLGMPDEELAELIRPAGTFRVKTRRLKAFLAYFVGSYAGDLSRMRAAPLPVLRRELLGVHGIGPETADCVLLYALEKPSFVVDAYTRRVFGRLGGIGPGLSYEALRARFMEALPPDVGVYNEYHALLVTLGKTVCRPRPRCAGCALVDLCATGRAMVG